MSVQWCVESDTLQFGADLTYRPPTRRGILSTVSSVFNPLGVLSPLILVRKRILQELCRRGKSWDEPVPEDLIPKWEKWRSELHLPAHVKVPRCYKPSGFGKVKSVELHCFADAIQHGYGQCSYLRLTNTQEQIHCSLVMAKSRIAPLKPITIPRLELTAALVSPRVCAYLRKELEYEDAEKVMWSDSKVALGYIRNDTRRFHVFVANRVQQIRELTTPEEWRYVDTKDNPADLASCGLSAQELINKSLWWNGPAFLWKPLDLQPQDKPNEPSTDDPEVKRVSTLATRVQNLAPTSLQETLNCFSDWGKAKRVLAICARWPNKGNHPEQDKRTCVNVEDVQQVEKVIIRDAQNNKFKDEIAVLKSSTTSPTTPECKEARDRNTAMKTTSCLYRLDPFLDEDGVLRVGGRVRHANLPDNVKHPCIIPRSSHVTNLIIDHYHEGGHQGQGMTLNTILSAGYWVIGGRRTIAGRISKCVKCGRQRGPTNEQKMADLPQDRLEPSPPFTFCAVDYFRPWHVKEGRRDVKLLRCKFLPERISPLHWTQGTSQTASI